MIIFEPQNRVEVSTPKGDGYIWLVTEFGSETDTIYTIIIKDSGEMWQMTHKDLKVKNNWTFNHK
jgi:hypothetical protein